MFINLSLLQALIKLVSNNFIRDKEEGKKQNELKMSIQTRIMRGLKLAIQAFYPIISLFKVSVKENKVPTENNSSRASIFATKASYIPN